MENERSFRGIWIPANIWLDEELTLMEKVFLVEIDSLDNDDGCFASNNYFSKFFKLSKNRCSEVINSLEKKGLLKIKYIYMKNSKAIEKRIIRVVNSPKKPIRKNEGGIRDLDRPIRKVEGGTRKIEEGYSENCEDNNTGINNTINNTTTTDVVVKIKTYFDFNEKETNKIIKALEEKKETLEYLEEKLKLTKNSTNTHNVVGYLISAIKNDYKSSINNYKCSIPQVKTRYHNINQTFTNYTPDELERLLIESQRDKFK